MCEDAAKQKRGSIGMSWEIRRVIDMNYPAPINLSLLVHLGVFTLLHR